MNRIGSLVMLYSPCNLDLDAFLRSSPYSHWLSDNLIVKLRFVVSTIYLFSIRDKDNVSSEGYVQLKFSYLKRIIGTRYVKTSIDILRAFDVIECDHRYVVGSKSYGYRFSARYSGRVSTVQVSCAALSKRLRDELLDDDVAQLIDAPSIYAYIQSNLNRLTFDLFAAEACISRYTGLKYDRRRMCVSMITHHTSFFKVHTATGRCFNAVTSAPKELRMHLRLDGEPVSEIDISCAQPAFTAALYPMDCLEKERYLSWIRDDFYSRLNEQAGKPCIDRDATKKACYKQVFFGDVYPQAPLWKAFCATFPILASIIVEQKMANKPTVARYKVVKGKRRLKRGNPGFALLLQKKEADIVIHGAGETLRQQSIPFVTVHDCILCRRGDAETVSNVLRASIKTATGFEATVTATPGLQEAA